MCNATISNDGLHSLNLPIMIWALGCIKLTIIIWALPCGSGFTLQSFFVPQKGFSLQSLTRILFSIQI
jgi:hypothetical protein